MIALVTTHEARGHDKDLGILSRALDACGAKWEIVDWDDQTIDWSQFDIAVLRSTWDYYERLGEFLVWARGVGARTRLFNPLDIVQWNVDKRYLIDLAQASIDVMPTTFVSRARDLDALDLSRDVIIKPAVSPDRTTPRVMWVMLLLRGHTSSASCARAELRWCSRISRPLTPLARQGSCTWLVRSAMPSGKPRSSG